MYHKTYLISAVSTSPKSIFLICIPWEQIQKGGGQLESLLGYQTCGKQLIIQKITQVHQKVFKTPSMLEGAHPPAHFQRNCLSSSTKMKTNTETEMLSRINAPLEEKWHWISLPTIHWISSTDWHWICPSESCGFHLEWQCPGTIVRGQLLPPNWHGFNLASRAEHSTGPSLLLIRKI